MKIKIKNQFNFLGAGLLFLIFFLSACDTDHHDDAHGIASEDHADEAIEIEKGPNNGRIFRDGNFSLELAIFEKGVPPEFRAWATKDGNKIAPENLKLKVNLTRLGNKVDNINFESQGDALRGDMEIYEPHSFVVEIIAENQGETHSWKYDNFEGRTKIENAVAKALEIETETAGPVVIDKTISAYGQIVENPENVRQVSARFEGVIKRVFSSVGEKVKKGQKLAIIESNESLKTYSIKAPISGLLMERNANPGEQTSNRKLFTIMNTSTVWAEVSIFPKDLKAVKAGLPVNVTTIDGEANMTGKIIQINAHTESNQSVKARVLLGNKRGTLIPGSFVMANVKVGEHNAKLAVKRVGLQAFRDFTVVYAKIGEEYEVRMLELGFQSGDWVEVLGGLEPDTEYVSANSYVIKADIEKSGAAHDH